MGYAREVLKKRRNIEAELRAIRKQRDLAGGVGGDIGSSMPKREKVPGKNEYVFSPPGTNNPEGAAIQHVDGYNEMLREREMAYSSEKLEAERIINLAEDSIDRAILRNYYCLGMTLRMTGREVGLDHSRVLRRMEAALNVLDAILEKSTKTHQNAPGCTTQGML